VACYDCHLWCVCDNPGNKEDGCLLVLLAILSFSCIFLVGVFPFFIMMFTSMRSFAYIYQVYFHATSSPSHSCFFMPCAPQKIGENDQAYSLFSGLFSLVVIEVLVPWLVRQLRKEWLEKGLFEQEVGERIELATRARTQKPAQVVSGSEIQPISRMQTGITVEEGRAGLRRSGTA